MLRAKGMVLMDLQSRAITTKAPGLHFMTSAIAKLGCPANSIMVFHLPPHKPTLSMILQTKLQNPAGDNRFMVLRS